MLDNKEIEVKILEIDEKRFLNKLQEIGASFIKKQYFKRYVFDTIPQRKGAWIRLRTDGKDSTLTLKEIEHDGIDGTKEFETKIDDFNTTLQILEKSGFKSHGYQENTRVLYRWGPVEISIDSWPGLPTYAEVEGPTRELVESTIEKLGYTQKDLTSENTEKIYARYGIDINTMPVLKF